MWILLALAASASDWNTTEVPLTTAEALFTTTSGDCSTVDSGEATATATFAVGQDTVAAIRDIVVRVRGHHGGCRVFLEGVELALNGEVFWSETIGVSGGGATCCEWYIDLSYFPEPLEDVLLEEGMHTLSATARGGLEAHGEMFGVSFTATVEHGRDWDGDGHESWRVGGGDCDDYDAAIHPDAPEVCDGIDNNCSGLVDAADPLVVDAPWWWPDADGDGYGDADAEPVRACEQPEGHVDNNLDCDDTDPDIHPEADEICDGIDNNCNDLVDEEDPDLVDALPWWPDLDGDGFGDAGAEPVWACEQPLDHVDNDLDCDDADPDVHPDADEVCDGVDNNCSGLVDDEDPAVLDQSPWWPDADGDGFGDAGASPVWACDQPAGHVGNNLDCDDDDPDIHPDADEVCDGIDNNCSGLVDDEDPDLVGGSPWWPDADGDGYGDAEAEPVWACEQPEGHVDNDLDCDDADPEVHPGAEDPENDCDRRDEEDDEPPDNGRAWQARGDAGMAMGEGCGCATAPPASFPLLLAGALLAWRRGRKAPAGASPPG